MLSRRPPKMGLNFFVCALMFLLTGAVTSRLDSPSLVQQTEANFEVVAAENFDAETSPSLDSEIDLKPVFLSLHEEKVGSVGASVSVRHGRRHGVTNRRSQNFVSISLLFQPPFLSVRNDLCVPAFPHIACRNILFPRFGRAPPVHIA